jgi:hypothetical protein
MYESTKKESTSPRPRRLHGRTTVNRTISRTPAAPGREPDQQIIEMERTFTDRWEW